MKDDLRKQLGELSNFKDDELFDILSRFQYESLKKGQWFYKEGRICRKIGFIRKGAIRSYYNLDGEEVTRFVLLENQFFTAFESFMTQTSSPEYIQAIEATEVYTLGYDELVDLYKKYPSMQEVGRKVTVVSHLRLEKRVFNLIALSAEERYTKFEEEHPEMMIKVPLQYIASILGMKPETLSRIRKKLKN